MKDTIKYLVIEWIKYKLEYLQLYYSNVIVYTCTPFISVYHLALCCVIPAQKLISCLLQNHPST